MLIVIPSVSSTGYDRLVPLRPLGGIGRGGVLAVVHAGVDAVPGEYLRDRGAAAVALVDLVHRQPGLDVLPRLAVEDPLAAVGAEVVPLALVLAAAEAGGRRVAHLGEPHRDLAGLAEHRQAGEEEPVALGGHPLRLL